MEEVRAEEGRKPGGYGILAERHRVVPYELAVMLTMFVGLSIVLQWADPYSGYSWLYISLVDVRWAVYWVLFSVSDVLLVSYIAFVSGDDYSMFGFVRPRLKRDLAWSVAAILGSGVVGLVALAIQPQLEPAFREWVEELRQERMLPFPIPILCILIGAASEEIIFRGYLLARLTEIHRSPLLGAITSSMAFAVVHLYQGPIGMLSAFALGLIFSAVVIRSRSLWPVAAAHFIGNAYAILAT